MKQEMPINMAQVGDYVVELDEKGLPTSRNQKTDENNVSSIVGAIREGKKALTLPYVGFKQPTSNGAQGEIEKEILEKEGIHPQDFQIPEMPIANAPGGLRTAIAPIIDFSMQEEKASTVNDPSIKFSFTLHRGSYATVLLREFMKPKDVIAAGF